MILYVDRFQIRIQRDILLMLTIHEGLAAFLSGSSAGHAASLPFQASDNKRLLSSGHRPQPSTICSQTAGFGSGFLGTPAPY